MTKQTEEKPAKRELTSLTTDVFKDQIDTLKAQTDETGLNRAVLVRMAIDKAYPRKKND
jgi:hypothetical protein